MNKIKNLLFFVGVVCFLCALVWWLWRFIEQAPSPYEKFSDRDGFNSRFFISKEAELSAGKHIFAVQCSSCHGFLGDGFEGKATNLKTWGTEAAIENTIKNGSKGMDYFYGEMPAGIVDDQTAKAVAAYVAKEISAIKTTKNEDLVEIGRTQWVTCAGCHGEDGKGMDAKAPDLTQYGSGEFVMNALKRGKFGKNGIMPNFSDSLNSYDEKAVAEYIISLSKDKNGRQQK